MKTYLLATWLLTAQYSFEVHVSYWLLIFHDDSNTIVLQEKMYDKAACIIRRDAIYDSYKPSGYTVKCEQVS